MRSIKGGVEDAIRDAVGMELDGRQVAAYVELVNPFCPGEPGYRTWHHYRRLLAGSLRRRLVRERTGMLPIGWGGD